MGGTYSFVHAITVNACVMEVVLVGMPCFVDLVSASQYGDLNDPLTDRNDFLALNDPLTDRETQ